MKKSLDQVKDKPNYQDIKGLVKKLASSKSGSKKL